MTRIDSLLFEALINQGRIPKESLEAYAKEAQDTAQALASVLLRHNAIPEQEILNIFSQSLALRIFPLKDASLEKAVLDKIPVKIATYYRFVPIEIKDRVLTIAVSMPLDIKTQDEIRTQLGYDIETVLSRSEDILDALKEILRPGSRDIRENYLPGFYARGKSCRVSRGED